MLEKNAIFQQSFHNFNTNAQHICSFKMMSFTWIHTDCRMWLRTVIEFQLWSQNLENWSAKCLLHCGLWHSWIVFDHVVAYFILISVINHRHKAYHPDLFLKFKELFSKIGSHVKYNLKKKSHMVYVLISCHSVDV